MAIVFISGLPGAGKSYLTVAHVIKPALDINRPIVTNIPLNLEEIETVYPSRKIIQFKTEDIAAYDGDWFKDRVPGGAVCVIDEIGLVWPSGLKANQAKDPDKEFIQMHRHRTGQVDGREMSTEIVLVGQSTRDVAAFVRSKIAKTYIVRKLASLGMSNRYNLRIYDGCQDTERPRAKDEIQSMNGTYLDVVTRFYTSHTQGDGERSSVDVTELQAEKKSTVWQSWQFKWGIPTATLAMIWGISSVLDFLHGPGGQVEAKPTDQVYLVEHTKTVHPAFLKAAQEKGMSVEPSEPLPMVEISADPVSAEPQPIPLSKEWRLAGVMDGTMEGAPRQGIVIASRSRGVRILDTSVQRDCRLSLYQEWECEFNDELITSYSGGGSSGYVQYTRQLTDPIATGQPTPQGNGYILKPGRAIPDKQGYQTSKEAEPVRYGEIPDYIPLPHRSSYEADRS